MADIFNIAGEINSTSQEGTAVHANQVKDDLQNKKQSQINEEVGEELELHTNRLNALTGQNYITVQATAQTTAADIPTLINASGEGEQADTLYRVGFWDGSAYVADKYTEYAWNGTAYVILDVKSSIGDVFDISQYNAVGGTLAIYADLAAALGASGANVPSSIRRGGMSIKFVCSSDNKYVQYRYMSTATTGTPNPFTNTANWQGVSDKIAYGDKDVVESGTIDTSIKIINAQSKVTTLCPDSWKYMVNSSGQVVELIPGWNSMLFYVPAGIKTFFTNFNFYAIAVSQNLPKLGDALTVKQKVEVSGLFGSYVGTNDSGCWCAITLSSTQTLPDNPEITFSFNDTFVQTPADVDINIKLNKFFVEDTYILNKTPYINKNKINQEKLVGWSSLILKVQNGDKFTIDNASAGIGGSAARVYAVFDKDGVQLTVCSTQSYTGVVSIEQEGYIIFNLSNENTGTVTANRMSSTQGFSHTLNVSFAKQIDALDSLVSSIVSSITTIQANTERLSAEYDALTEHVQSKNLFDKTKAVTDEVVTTGGALANISVWKYNKCTGMIPVLPNKFYQISGDNIGNARNIVCYDETGTTLMKVLAPSNGATLADCQMPNADGSGAATSMNVQFKTPANAAFVRFNVGSYFIDSIDTAMIEYVGDTYNPDFVPSPYEEYVNKDVVKESAMPLSYKNAIDAADNANNAVNRNFKIRLLLIGSSHGMNTIAQFPWIAYKAGFDVEVGNVYIGSLSMQRLVGMIRRNENIAFKIFKNGVWEAKENMKFNDVLMYTDWNFISLQRSATDDELWLTTQKEADEEQNVMTDINYQVPGASPVYMSHTEALQILLDRITNVATKHPAILFNTGFADPRYPNNPDPDPTSTNNIIQTANMMKAEFGIEYYPTAIAIRNARNTYLRNIGAWYTHSLCYDSQHLDYGIGCYVASITLLEYILRKFGWDVESINTYGTQEELVSFVSVATPTNYTEPTEETMTVAKACAKTACNMVDSVSAAIGSRFKWQVSYNLASGITSSNTKGYSTDEDIYTTTLSGTITSVTVTMGGVDITSAAYNAGVVTISSVTGDVVIDAN